MESQVMSPFPLFGAEDLDSIENMMQFVRRCCEEKGYTETLDALSFAEKCHEGQFRKNRKKIPYITHPLTIAIHAITLGLNEQDILSACLLHDTIEDCGVSKEELPVSDRAKELVDLLTIKFEEGETRAQAKERYFKRLSKDPEAAMIKLLDRCNNVSFMADAFSVERMWRYIEETERYIYPLPMILREERPEWSNIAFDVKYHIFSVISSIKNVLERDLSK